MQPRILSRVVGWAKTHRFHSLEFEERGESLWAFMRTWEKGTFRRVAVTVADRFAVDATHKLSVLGSVVAAVGGLASLFAISGGSHVLTDTYGEYLGSGYSHKLVEYPVFDLRPWNDACRRCPLPSLDLWIPSLWRSFLSHGWRGRIIATGWCHVPVFVVPSSQESCRCRRWLMSSATSWASGFSSLSTSRRLVERQLSGIIHSALLIHLQFSHLHLAVFF